MLVTDLNHFADLSEDTPGLARRLAGHLGDIVRAATAGDAEPHGEPCCHAGVGPLTAAARAR